MASLHLTAWTGPFYWGWWVPTQVPFVWYEAFILQVPMWRSALRKSTSQRHEFISCSVEKNERRTFQVTLPVHLLYQNRINSCGYNYHMKLILFSIFLWMVYTRIIKMTSNSGLLCGVVREKPSPFVIHILFFYSRTLFSF